MSRLAKFKKVKTAVDKRNWVEAAEEMKNSLWYTTTVVVEAKYESSFGSFLYFWEVFYIFWGILLGYINFRCYLHFWDYLHCDPNNELVYNKICSK